jgi:beta-phosphoglucomutase
MSKGHLEAAIWDMDGVIADTVEYHFQVWKEEFAKKGINYTMGHFLRFFGQRNDTIIKDALGVNISPDELDTINTAKQANFRRRVAGHIHALPGAVELIRLLDEHNVKQAIASSSPPENIETITNSLDIACFFSAVVYGLEVPEGKPNPQIYLLAAQKLGVKPADCIVFEDAIAGVAGARRAGMKSVGVASSHPVAELKRADLVVASLKNVSFDDLTALFDRSRTKK